MSSSKKFVEYVVGQIVGNGSTAYRAMFGEYCIYYDDKVVALICDDRLLVKVTEEGRTFVGDVIEAEPYPGAKPAILIKDKIEDTEWLSELIQLTADALPTPKKKPKKPAKKKGRSRNRKE